jgi:hypothetical protein
MEYVIFSVNFGLKTKMHSIVINKKILKLIYIYIYLKKKQQKKNLRWQPPSLVEGVAREPPLEVAPATSRVAHSHPRPKGWPHGHSKSFLGKLGGSQATRPPLPPTPFSFSVFFFYYFV